MNRIILLGRLTKDSELRYTPSKKAVCQFTLAVPRPFNNSEGQREADFIPILLWGKQAEVASSGLGKGQRCLVEGRLQLRNYEGKDGQKHYVTEVVADHFEFIEKKEQSFQAAGEEYAKAVSHQAGNEKYASSIPFDEEVPF